MPKGISSVLSNPDFAPDELSMSIIEGLTEKIEERVEQLPECHRLRISFEIKKTEE